MKKPSSLLLTTGIVVSLILSGCAQPPMAAPSAPAPTAPLEQAPAIEPSSPPSLTPDSSSVPEQPAAPPDTTLPLGRVEIRVTDAPPREAVTSILVTVAENSVEIHKAVAEQEQEQEQIGEGEQNQNQEQEQEQEHQGEGEWLALDMIEGASQFDLLRIKGLEEILAVGDVEPGKYTQIRIAVEKVEVALGDGELEEAKLSGGEIKFVRPFDVVEGADTILLLDFDAEKSVAVTGQGEINVKPVVKLTIQQGKPHEVVSAEGTISEADTLLDTVSIIPDGATEALVLDVTPQTEITLDDVEAALGDLDGLGEGASATVFYYLDSLKAIRIDAYSP